MQSVRYRNAHRAEMPAVVDLWNQVFGVEHRFFESLLEAENHFQQKQTLVAAQPDGRLVASVQIFLRHKHGLDGRIDKVGCIGSVSCLESERGHGHARTLMKLAVERMRELSCDWSFLMTGIHDYYAYLGYKTRPFKVFEGDLNPPLPSRYRTLVPANYRESLPELKRIHRAFNADRPLSDARDPKHWLTSGEYRLGRDAHRLALAFAPRAAHPCAYAIAEEGDPKTIKEFGALPGHESALPDTFRAALGEAHHVRIEGPGDPVSRGQMGALLGFVHEVEHGYRMAMALGGVDEAYLDRLFADQRAVHWRADDF